MHNIFNLLLAILAILAMVAGYTGDISPQNVSTASAAVGDVIASDDFESANWVGGSGWLAGWQVPDYKSEITPFYSPHGGSYHLHIIYDGAGGELVSRGRT
jgi:hypothetical protein